MTLPLPGLTSVQIIANPAVTVGRAFTDTFAGIHPGSVAAFVLAQLAGLAVAVVLLAALYPHVGEPAPDPHVGEPAPDPHVGEPADQVTVAHPAGDAGPALASRTS